MPERNTNADYNPHENFDFEEYNNEDIGDI